jgi:hypothetical protein
MKNKNVVVSSNISTFLTACLDSIRCFRCDKKFRSKESTAFHAQVHRMKISTTLTGGVLCERCSKSFRKWAEIDDK